MSNDSRLPLTDQCFQSLEQNYFETTILCMCKPSINFKFSENLLYNLLLRKCFKDVCTQGNNNNTESETYEEQESRANLGIQCKDIPE